LDCPTARAAGLTGFVAGIARKTVINNVTINALLPGPLRYRSPARPGRKGGSGKARHYGGSNDRRARQDQSPPGRVGDPEEFGLACAFLCGAKAGFITGQNILIDGGAFPGHALIEGALE